MLCSPVHPLLSGLRLIPPRPQPQLSLKTLAGEYTDSADPDTPLSFYESAGKLFVESERMVPTELRPLSAVEFGLPNSRRTLRFDLDASGQGVSVSYSNEPLAGYRRTGAPVHHLFHDYQRTEVMIPMRDGVKLHAVILKPADIARTVAVPRPTHALRR